MVAVCVPKAAVPYDLAVFKSATSVHAVPFQASTVATTASLGLAPPATKPAVEVPLPFM